MAFERGRPTKLIGDDFNAFCNEVAKTLEADFLKLEQREREAAALQRELSARTYFVAVRHLLGRNGDPIEIETERLPLAGAMRATGADYDHALANLYYGLAQRLWKVGFAETWDDARLAACERFTFIPSVADSIGLVK